LNAGLLATGDGDDPLAALKGKMAADKAAKQKQLGAAVPSATPAKPASSPDAASAAAKPAATAAAKPDASVEAKPAAPAAAKPAAPAAAKPAAGDTADVAAEAPRPEVKIDTSKLEAELAALRAALAKGELDDK
jgi:hypothetical protein